MGEELEEKEEDEEEEEAFFLFFLIFLDATTHLYKRLCPSVGPSVGRSVCPSVPRYFQTLKIEVFECGKSSNV